MLKKEQLYEIITKNYIKTYLYKIGLLCNVRVSDICSHTSAPEWLYEI